MPERAGIRTVTVEYETLRVLIDAFEKSDFDVPEHLIERRSALVRLLIDAPAASAKDLAYKATVLLDWTEPCDVPACLARSLCRDTVRLFPVADSLLVKAANEDVWPRAAATSSYEDLMRAAQRFLGQN